MDHDGGPQMSLAVRLMQVAGEYEIERKKERRAMENRLAEAQELHKSTDAQLQAMKGNADALSRRVAQLGHEIEARSRQTDTAVVVLERQLVAARFLLAQRTQELQLLLSALRECATAQSRREQSPNCEQENLDPGGSGAASAVRQAAWAKSIVAAAFPGVSAVADFDEVLAELRAEQQETAPHGHEVLLSAASRGLESVVDSVLTPSSQAGQSHAPSAALPARSAELLHSVIVSAARHAAAAGHAGVVRKLFNAAALSPLPDVPTKRVVTWAVASSPSGHGDDQTLLHLAAGATSAAGAEALVKMLVSPSPQQAAPMPVPVGGLDDADAYLRTPLHAAAAAGNAAAARVLLMAGADPTRKDIHGHTPADLAAGTHQLLLLQEVNTAAPPKAGASKKSSGRASNNVLGAPEADSTAALARPLEHLRTGEVAPNAPQPGVARLLTDASVMFWNDSVRANRAYNERAFERAIDAYSAALELATGASLSNVSPRDLATLYYNRARSRFRLGAHCAAVDDCTVALRHDETYRNALAQRAECYMSLFDFDRAAKDFASLLEGDPSDRQWSRRLADARAMRDMGYYGILGVRRTADAGAVKRAYRALCLRWHPDKHDTSPEDAQRSHTAFKRITDAYETLTDTYKRMMYDLEPNAFIGEPPPVPAIPAHLKGAFGSHRGASFKAGMPTAQQLQPEPDATAVADGFDRWYSREKEREVERDRERAEVLQREAEANQAAEAKRASFRAQRRKAVEERAAASVAAPTAAVPKAAPTAAPLPAPAAVASNAAIPIPAKPKPAPVGVSTNPINSAQQAPSASAPPTQSKAAAAVAAALASQRSPRQAATREIGTGPAIGRVRIPTPDSDDASPRAPQSQSSNAAPPMPPPVPRATPRPVQHHPQQPQPQSLPVPTPTPVPVGTTVPAAATAAPPSNHSVGGAGARPASPPISFVPVYVKAGAGDAASRAAGAPGLAKPSTSASASATGSGMQARAATFFAAATSPTSAAAAAAAAASAAAASIPASVPASNLASPLHQAHIAAGLGLQSAAEQKEVIAATVAAERERAAAERAEAFVRRVQMNSRFSASVPSSDNGVPAPGSAASPPVTAANTVPSAASSPLQPASPAISPASSPELASPSGPGNASSSARPGSNGNRSSDPQEVSQSHSANTVPLAPQPPMQYYADLEYADLSGQDLPISEDDDEDDGDAPPEVPPDADGSTDDDDDVDDDDDDEDDGVAGIHEYTQSLLRGGRELSGAEEGEWVNEPYQSNAATTSDDNNSGDDRLSEHEMDAETYAEYLQQLAELAAQGRLAEVGQSVNARSRGTSGSAGFVSGLEHEAESSTVSEGVSHTGSAAYSATDGTAPFPRGGSPSVGAAADAAEAASSSEEAAATTGPQWRGIFRASLAPLSPTSSAPLPPMTRHGDPHPAAAAAAAAATAAAGGSPLEGSNANDGRSHRTVTIDELEADLADLAANTMEAAARLSFRHSHAAAVSNNGSPAAPTPASAVRNSSAGTVSEDETASL